MVGLVFFGIHLLIIGYLALRSDYVPKVLAVLLLITPVGYFIDGFGKILSSGYDANYAMITFVGLGCPRQEVWAYEFGNLLAMPTVAVGAAFDFHAGYLKQAPNYLQRGGLEWAFRLAIEPRRLWRRYLILNPLYMMLVVLQLTKLRHFALDDVCAPVSEKLFG